MCNLVLIEELLYKQADNLLGKNLSLYLLIGVDDLFISKEIEECG